MAELKSTELEEDFDFLSYLNEDAECRLHSEISWKIDFQGLLPDWCFDEHKRLMKEIEVASERAAEEERPKAAEMVEFRRSPICDWSPDFRPTWVLRCCPLAEQIKHVHVRPHVMTVLKKLKDLGETSVGVRISIIDDDKVFLQGIDEALLSKTVASLLDTYINSSVGKRYKLDKAIMRLLREQKFVDHINKILEERGVNVAWKANSGNWNSITIYGMTKADVDCWLQVMKDELVCYKIQLNDRMLKTLKHHSWFEARKEFESNPLLVLEKKGTMMKLYGTRDETEIAKRKIEELVCVNNIGIKISLQLPSSFSLPFGSLFDECRSIVESFWDDSLKIECDEANGSFVISGPNQLVPEIEKKIKGLVDNIVLEEVYVKQLGMSEQSLSVVRKKLQNISMMHGVFIEHAEHSAEYPESCQEFVRENTEVTNQAAQLLSGSSMNEPCPHSGLQNTGTVRLKIMEIFECRLDAIAHAVNDCWKLDGNVCGREENESDDDTFCSPISSSTHRQYLTDRIQKLLKLQQADISQSCLGPLASDQLSQNSKEDKNCKNLGRRYSTDGESLSSLTSSSQSYDNVAEESSSPTCRSRRHGRYESASIDTNPIPGAINITNNYYNNYTCCEGVHCRQSHTNHSCSSGRARDSETQTDSTRDLNVEIGAVNRINKQSTRFGSSVNINSGLYTSDDPDAQFVFPDPEITTEPGSDIITVEKRQQIQTTVESFTGSHVSSERRQSIVVTSDLERKVDGMSRESVASGTSSRKESSQPSTASDLVTIKSDNEEMVRQQLQLYSKETGANLNLIGRLGPLAGGVETDEGEVFDKSNITAIKQQLRSNPSTSVTAEIHSSPSFLELDNSYSPRSFKKERMNKLNTRMRTRAEGQSGTIFTCSHAHENAENGKDIATDTITSKDLEGLLSLLKDKNGERPCIIIQNYYAGYDKDSHTRHCCRCGIISSTGPPERSASRQDLKVQFGSVKETKNKIGSNINLKSIIAENDDIQDQPEIIVHSEFMIETDNQIS